MAKTLTKLSVGIGGDFSGLSKAFSGAASAASGFGSKIAGIGSGLVKFTGIGAAITAGVGLIGGSIGGITAVKEAFEGMDVNAKLSDRLGIATEKLVGLQHAANLAGISSEDVTVAFEHMFKSLGKAGDDGEKSADAINAMGLSVDALTKMKPDEAFAVISDKIAGIKNPTERATAAIAIFGKGAQSLLPLLMSGSQGIAAAQKEAEKLGLTYSRIDAKKIEDANDAITRLKAVGTGIAQNIAVGLAPLVTGIATKITGITVAMLPLLKGAWDQVYNYVAPVVMGIYDFVAANWTKMVDATVAAGVGIWNTISGTFSAISQIASAVWNAVSAVWSWGTELITGQSADAADGATGSFENILSGVQAFAEGLTTGINIAAYSLNHLQDVADIAGEGIIYGLVKLGNQAEYVFTTAIPYGIRYAIASMQDFSTGTMTTLNNVAANIGAFVLAIPGLLTGALTLDDVKATFTPLSAGFESEVDKLGKLAERIPGELEKALGEDLDAKTTAFGKGLNEYLDEQDKKAGNISEKIKNALREGWKGLGDPAGGATSPIITPKLDPSTLTLGIQPEIKSAKLIKFGSAQQRLASAELSQSLHAAADAGLQAPPAATGIKAPSFATTAPRPSLGFNVNVGSGDKDGANNSPAKLAEMMGGMLGPNDGISDLSAFAAAPTWKAAPRAGRPAHAPAVAVATTDVEAPDPVRQPRPVAIAVPLPAHAGPSSTASASGSQEPSMAALEVLKIISRYIIKWDTNPPVGTV
jgi:hypothetical protein